MPTLVISNGPLIQWGARGTSRVRVTHPHPFIFFGINDPVSLDLPRTAFKRRAALLDTVTQLVKLLIQDSERRRAKRDTLTVACRLPLKGHPRATLTLPRAGLSSLRDTLQFLGDPDVWTGPTSVAERMGQMLCIQCFDQGVFELIATTPRRWGVLSRYLTRFLPSAFLATGTLVNLARKNAKVRESLAEIFEDDAELAAYRDAADHSEWNLLHAAIVGLVDRAFRGAWEKVGLPGLMYRASRAVAQWRAMGDAAPHGPRYRNPTNVLREYHYGRSQSLSNRLRQLERHDRARYSFFLYDSAQLFLGEPGAAARALQISS